MVLTLRNRLKLLIYVGVGLVLLLSMVGNGEGLGISLQRLTYVEAGLFLLIVLFERWLWKQRLFLKFLRTGPLLRGTWKGVIRPTGDGDPEIPAFLSVEQTFSSISLRLMTHESVSESKAVHLSIRDDGLGVVEYSYQNDPRDSVRDRSEIHYGAVRLEASGDIPDLLTGSYFTDRRTKGELEFDGHNPAVSHSHASAERLFD